MGERPFSGAAALREARPETHALCDSRLDMAASAVVSLCPNFTFRVICEAFIGWEILICTAVTLCRCREFKKAIVNATICSARCQGERHTLLTPPKLPKSPASSSGCLNAPRNHVRPVISQFAPVARMTKPRPATVPLLGSGSATSDPQN